MKISPRLFVPAFIVVAVVLCLLCLVLGPYWVHPARQLYFDIERRLADPQRHLLFCEQLKPGVSVEEARNVISQYGGFTESQEEVSTGTGDVIKLKIYFKDQEVDHRFGDGFTLIFIQGKYANAMYYYQMGDASSPSLVDYDCSE